MSILPISPIHKKPSQGLTYEAAGVDIDAGAELVERIKPFAKNTQRPGVLDALGGFAALFELPKGFDEPVLVSATDGVGTKLKLAFKSNQHSTIGIDLVAMCVNDIIVQGAEPLFFLDYYATSKLDVTTAATVIQGISEGCRQAGCALVGGETAEMPGLYQPGDYDLAGFCVGIVEKKKIINGSRIQVGDAIIGLASSGLHSNGFSLVNQLLTLQNPSLIHTKITGQSLIDTLLAPTRIYVKPLLSLCNILPVHGMAHITGGGLLENIPRVLPKDTQAVLYRHQWQRPAIFGWLQETGNIDEYEMLRTFNCGIGMVVIVPAEHADAALAHLKDQGETAWKIGAVRQRNAETKALSSVVIEP